MTFRRLSVPEMVDQRIAESVLIIAPPFFYEACRAGRVELARYLNSRGADLDRAPNCRKYNEFARKMKVVVPTVPIEDNLPQVPGITVEVH